MSYAIRPLIWMRNDAGNFRAAIPIGWLDVSKQERTGRWFWMRTYDLGGGINFDTADAAKAAAEAWWRDRIGEALEGEA